MTDDQERYSEPRFDTLSTPSAPYAPIAASAPRTAVALSELTRFLAVSRDATHLQAFDLSSLWHALCSGTRRIQDSFSTEHRCYVVIEQPATGTVQGVGGRGLEMLERVLAGESAKAVTIDLRVAPSTVAAAMSACLKRMGLRGCRVSSVPVLLVMAAQSARGRRVLDTSSRIASLEQSGNKVWVVSAPRPDLDIPVPLSNAELAVIRELVAGSTHAQISHRRGTSPRTVANQLATAFRKLGVSGRREVVDRLIAHALGSRSPAVRE